MFTKIFKRESNPKDVLSEIQSLKTDVCKYKEEHQRLIITKNNTYSFILNRNQLIIEKMEQKINQQQIEIFKLKKKLKSK